MSLMLEKQHHAAVWYLKKIHKGAQGHVGKPGQSRNVNPGLMSPGNIYTKSSPETLEQDAW